MPLPSHIARALPTQVRQVMEAQWDIYRQQRKILKEMRQNLFHLRAEIQHKDQSPKFCDL